MINIYLVEVRLSIAGFAYARLISRLIRSLLHISLFWPCALLTEPYTFLLALSLSLWSSIILTGTGTGSQTVRDGLASFQFSAAQALAVAHSLASFFSCIAPALAEHDQAASALVLKSIG